MVEASCFFSDVNRQAERKEREFSAGDTRAVARRSRAKLARLPLSIARVSSVLAALPRLCSTPLDEIRSAPQFRVREVS